MTAADILVEELQARGVPYIATLNGHGLDPFYVACERAGMHMIDVRNEQAASYIAEVTGRLSRTVGVCAVSGAIAHANALAGVVNAWFDGAPMLLITGITPLAALGQAQFQDMNPVPMATPVCKYARLLDSPEDLAQHVHEAFEMATSGRPGPVHLALPMDIAETEVDMQAERRSADRQGDVRIEGDAPAELIEEICGWLAMAERPFLVAGSGVYYARGETELAAFVQQQKIPFATPIWDRGSVPDALEEYMGVIGAASGGASLLADTDLLILAGAELDYRIGHAAPPAIPPNARVVRIHADPTRLQNGQDAHLNVQASPAAVLRQLREKCADSACPTFEDWLRDTQQRKAAHYQLCLERAGALPGLNGADVVLAVNEVLSDDALLMVDGGNIGQWFHQLMNDRYPGHWVGCGASGVVGWGIPGAMAARAQEPDRPILLLSGDGAFTFTLAELECAARQGLHFVVVVADDEEWGITITGQLAKYGHPLYSKLGPIQFDKVAEGLGCRGVRVETKEALIPALREGLETKAVTVIHVPIVPGSPSG